MYMRITRGRADPAAADRLARLAREVDAAVGMLPGFQHIHTGIDRATGTIAVVSLWDTEAHARFSRAALSAVLTEAVAAGAGLDRPAVYELPP